MQLYNIYAFLLCVFVLVFSINAESSDDNLNQNFGEFGASFGEGVLKPGYDTGEGYFTELDAPSLTAPEDDPSELF